MELTKPEKDLALGWARHIGINLQPNPDMPLDEDDELLLMLADDSPTVEELALYDLLRWANGASVGYSQYPADAKPADELLMRKVQNAIEAWQRPDAVTA